MERDAGQRFRARAATLGLDIEVVEFPSGTRTADDAASAIGCTVAQIVKSLVLMANDAPLLALTSGANRVDLTQLAAHLGAARVRMATADEAHAATGYAIGGTPPFGHPADLLTVCDRDLTRFAEVWAAAGTPMSVFRITPDRLLEVTGATPVAFAA